MNGAKTILATIKKINCMYQNGAEKIFVQMIKIIHSTFCPYSLMPIQDIQTRRARKTYTSAKSDFCDDTNLHI